MMHVRKRPETSHQTNKCNEFYDLSRQTIEECLSCKILLIEEYEVT